MTVRDLIRRSLMLIGVLGEGETPSAEQLQDGFLSLKEMLESWSLESLTIPFITREEFALVPGQAVYTIGAAGNFATSRPIQILSAASLVDGSEFSIRVMAPSEWIGETTKALTSSLPTDIYYEESAGLGKIHVFPVPDQAVTLVLYTAKPIGAFTSVNDALSVPPGYARAIRYNFAIEVADEYERPVSQSVAMIAGKSLGNLKRQNSKARFMIPDTTSGAQTRGFNILTGE